MTRSEPLGSMHKFVIVRFISGKQGDKKMKCPALGITCSGECVVLASARALLLGFN